MKRLLLGISAALLAVCAAAFAVNPKPPQAADAEKAIAAMNANYVAATNSGDVARLVTMYDTNAVLMPQGAPPQRGIDAIRAYWTAFLRNGSVKIALTTESVTQSCDLASETGAYDVTLTPPNGTPAIHDTGKYVVTWRRINGQWKAISDIFNSNVAPK